MYIHGKHTIYVGKQVVRLGHDPTHRTGKGVLSGFDQKYLRLILCLPTIGIAPSVFLFEQIDEISVDLADMVKGFSVLGGPVSYN